MYGHNCNPFTHTSRIHGTQSVRAHHARFFSTSHPHRPEPRSAPRASRKTAPVSLSLGCVAVAAAAAACMPRPRHQPLPPSRPAPMPLCAGHRGVLSLRHLKVSAHICLRHPLHECFFIVPRSWTFVSSTVPRVCHNPPYLSPWPSVNASYAPAHTAAAARTQPNPTLLYRSLNAHTQPATRRYRPRPSLSL